MFWQRCTCIGFVWKVEPSPEGLSNSLSTSYKNLRIKKIYHFGDGCAEPINLMFNYGWLVCMQTSQPYQTRTHHQLPSSLSSPSLFCISDSDWSVLSTMTHDLFIL
jgi:hypothetical protein